MKHNALQGQDPISRDLIVQGPSINSEPLREEHSQKARTQGQESMKQEANSIFHKRVSRCFLAEIKLNKNRYQAQDNTTGIRSRNCDLLHTKLETKHETVSAGMYYALLAQEPTNRVTSLQGQNLRKFVLGVQRDDH